MFHNPMVYFTLPMNVLPMHWSLLNVGLLSYAGFLNVNTCHYTLSKTHININTDLINIFTGKFSTTW